ncbi:MAG: 4-hydroxy-3-methylbut-2-enyl diphosphate reductase [Candidatus Ozemobacteraceae bacterium]
MEIMIARHSGFCYGVKRAVDMVWDLVRIGVGPIHVLGNLIHNPTVVEELAKAGVKKVGRIEDAKSGILVIRSHGVPRQVISEAKERGLTVIDTTCPNVKLTHDIAQSLTESGYQVIIVGDLGHAEVEGILSYTDDRGIVVQEAKAVEENAERLKGKKIGVLCQTTIQLHILKEVVDSLIGRSRELLVHNTICDVTSKRQASTLELARTVDVMVIVGGRESANTARLAEISSLTGVPTHKVESASDLDPKWFQRDSRVGLAAGASTPSEVIEMVKSTLHSWEANGTLDENT